jgi:PAS domain S-box-containing protein
MDTRYRQLADHLPEAVYSCDNQGVVIDFNPAAVTLWGRAPEVGAEYWCGSHAMYTREGVALRHDECPMAVAIREQREVGRVEAVVERPDGERRYVLAHPRLLRDEAGRVIGAVNVVVDITERRRAEDQMRRIDELKDAFISTVAHELRNPLSPILSAAQLIAATDDTGTIKHMAQIIDRQAHMLGRLVNDLFDVSRIGRGELPLHKVRLAFDKVLQTALDVVRPSVDLRGQQLRINGGPPGLVVECDDLRVAQLIGNVLVNASKYTQEGGAIAVDVAVVGRELVIDIADNGIGIAPGRLADIFTLYHQVDDQDMQKQGGMGIGLSLVHDLCRGHGGRVQAYSDGPGLGSRFEIVLPIVLPMVAQALH